MLHISRNLRIAQVAKPGRLCRPGPSSLVASLTRNKIGYRYYQYNGGPQPIRKRSRLMTGMYLLGGLGVVLAYGYYMYWPKHTFPPLVAKILRKGLWAESDKGDQDFQLALKYYLEALDHYLEIGGDTLSDEFTGVQLKVAEMFERMNMLEDASFVYNEIATLYLSVLTAPVDSEMGRRVIDTHHRRHLIQKDLRVAIKLVELTSDTVLSKAILMTHLLIAQDEVNRAMGGRGFALTTQQGQGTSISYLPDPSKPDVAVTASVVKTPEVWEPFADEFFNALDLFGALCVSTGDLATAARVKISMTESMLLADAEPNKFLLSQCNLGSILYLQAEEFEAEEIAFRRKFATAAGIDPALVSSPDRYNALDAEKRENLVSTVSDADKTAYAAAISNKERCIGLSIKSYESVLELAKSIDHPQDTVQSPISQTVALATYGLGVINLHLLHYDRAERLLRESRVRSKSCGYEELITEIERELSKLFTEKKALQSGTRQAVTQKIEMDIHLKK